MKKILAAVLASVIITSPFANALTLMGEEVTVSAPSKPVLSSSNEPTTDELEKIIKLVKPKLDVPEECTSFDWNYTAATFYNQASWRMTWYDKEYTKEVNIVCDDNGNIISYNFYENNRDRTTKLPEFSKEKLAKVASDFLKTLAPDAAENMKLESSYASSLYSKSFIYNFQRYENGVIVPDNSASVTVNYVTGKPTAMNIGYNRYVTFEGTPSVDSETAKKLLTENQKMLLSYKLRTEYDDNGNKTNRIAYLVYTPEISYLSVDALTGKVYTERNTWSVLATGGAGASDKFLGSVNGSLMEDAAESESEYQLTEEELAQLDVLENLITREEAIKIITGNKYLHIEPEATAIEAQLRQVHNYDYYIPANGKEDYDSDNYQWKITFSAPYKASSETGYYRPYMNATVDAQTGSIISFSSSAPGYDYYEITEKTLPELKYTKENASEIFTEFAKTVIPELVEKTRLSNTYDSNVIKYLESADGKSIPVYRTSSVNLVRVNEGVDFTYNGIDGAVDLVTGKITRFSYNWYDDVVFESPKNAITANDAYRVLLDSDGFGLNYEINSNYTYNKYLEDQKDGFINYDELYTTEQYTRLVYSGYNYLSTTVLALTGEMVNYSGLPVQRKSETDYNDISGHWAEKDIRTLVDLGFSFDGTEFKPDSFITYEEFEKLMQFFGKYVSENIVENLDKNVKFTRTDAVKCIIDAQGYYKIASMPDIFITDFADNSELLREDVGFIAIARGFGLVQGDMGKFRPYDNITRAEAVTIIMNFIKLSY